MQVALETSAAQSAHVPASVAASAGLALASPVQAVYLVAETTPEPAVKPAAQGQCKQQLMLLLKGPHIHFCPALSCALPPLVGISCAYACKGCANFAKTVFPTKGVYPDVIFTFSSVNIST